MGNLAQNIASLPKAKASAEDAELQAFAAKLKVSLGASGVAIAYLSADPTRMVCVASSGDSAPPVGTLLDINSGISGRCISEDRMLDSYDTAVDPRVNREACERLGIRSLAVAPVHGSSGVVGVVEVFATDPGWFSREALARIAQAAEDVSLLYQRVSQEITTPARDAEAGREKRLKLVLPFSKPAKGTASTLETNSEQVAQHQTFSPVRSSFLRIRLVQEGYGPVAILLLALTLAVLPASWLISGFRSRTSNASTPARRLPHAGAGPTTSSESVNIATAQEMVSDATPPVRIIMAKALTGNTDAQASLADHYAAGDGVKKDAVKAAAWYIVAGSRGNESATKTAVEISRSLQPFEIAQVRFNLGTMFRDGIGTAPDLITAYLWFSLADLAGDVRAPGAQRNLEQVMPTSDIAEAQRKTTQWLHSQGHVRR